MNAAKTFTFVKVFVVIIWAAMVPCCARLERIQT